MRIERKCRSYDKHYKTSWNDDLEACDSILQIGHLLGCNKVN